MKKHFILGIMALAAIASCTKSEVLNQESLQEKGVTFSAYVVNATETKTTTLTGVNVSDAGIGILGWRTGSINATANGTNGILDNEAPNFMPNFKLTKVDGKWTYSPMRYWPSTGMKVSYYAYAPYTDGTTTNDYHPENIVINNVANINAVYDATTGDKKGGQYLLQLTVPKATTNTGVEYKNCTDLLVSRKGNGVNETGLDASERNVGFNQNLNKEFAEDGSKVNFLMKHALSKVSFVAKAGNQKDSYQDVRVIIDNLELVGNFANKGQYDLFNENWIVADENKHHSYAYINNTDAAVSPGDDNDPFTLLADELVNKNGTEVVVKAGENPVTTGWYYLTKPENDLMLIPSLGNEAAKITEIKGQYRIVTYDPTTGAPLTNPGDVDVIKFNETVNITLEEGKFYIFRLNIELTAVEFDVQVEDWIDGGKYDVVSEYIKDSYVVTNRDEFEVKLPLSYKTLPGKAWDDASTPASLPWLVVEFEETQISATSPLKVKVEGPNNFVKEIEYNHDATVSLLTLEKDELGTEIVNGDWKVTINGKSTVIKVPAATETLMTNYFAVTDKASFEAKLPMSYRQNHVWNDATTPATLPWLVAIVNPFDGDLNITVKKDNVEKSFVWPITKDNEGVITISNEAGEMDGALTAGDWTLTINGESVVITIPDLN